MKFVSTAMFALAVTFAAPAFACDCAKDCTKGKDGKMACEGKEKKCECKKDDKSCNCADTAKKPS